MSTLLGRLFEKRPYRRSKSKARNLHRTALRLEALERREVMTATMYVDFGFAFPGGALTVSETDMRSAGINGPVDWDHDNNSSTARVSIFGTGTRLVNLTSTVQTYGINLNGDLLSDQADARRLADQTLNLIRQIYAPFDVNVVERSSANINNIRNTLASTNTNDSYVIVAGTDPAAAPAFGWSQIDAGNARDNLSFAFADRIIANLGGTGAWTALARSASHEAAHSFGLEHTNAAQTLPIGDLMGAPVGGVDNRRFDTFHTISRYPMPLATGSGVQNGYDLLANSNVGLRPGSLSYVTGTGAHDIITLGRNSVGSITVSVDSYSNKLNDTYTNRIPVPGSTVVNAPYWYTVPANAPILIEAGVGNDRVVINGDLGVAVTVRGMDGVDSVVMNGKGATSGSFVPGTYTPSGLDLAPDFRGKLTVGSTVVSFQEFEDSSFVTVQNVGNFTVGQGGKLAGSRATFIADRIGVLNLDASYDAPGIVKVDGNTPPEQFASAGSFKYERIRSLATGEFWIAGPGAVKIKGPAGSTRFDVAWTSPNLTTTIDTGYGNATINVTGTQGVLNLDSTAPAPNLYQARNTVRVGSSSTSLASVAGQVNVSNSSGKTTLTIDDSFESVGHRMRVTNNTIWPDSNLPTAITYNGGVSALNILGGNGSNRFTVESTSAVTPLGITTKGGSDTVFIGRRTIVAATGQFNQPIAVVAHTLVDIAGPISVHSSNISGKTDIVIDGSADTARNLTLNSNRTSLAGLPAITYTGANNYSVSIVQGNGAHILDVQSVAEPITLYNTQSATYATGAALNQVTRIRGIPTTWEDGRTDWYAMPPLLAW